MFRALQGQVKIFLLSYILGFFPIFGVYHGQVEIVCNQPMARCGKGVHDKKEKNA